MNRIDDVVKFDRPFVRHYLEIMDIFGFSNGRNSANDMTFFFVFVLLDCGLKLILYSSAQKLSKTSAVNFLRALEVSF